MFLLPMIARRRCSPVMVSFDVAAATDKTGGTGEDRRARGGRGVGRRHSSPVNSKQVTEVASTGEKPDPIQSNQSKLNRLNSPPSDKLSPHHVLPCISVEAYNIDDSQYEIDADHQQRMHRTFFDTVRANVCALRLGLGKRPCPRDRQSYDPELGQRFDQLLYEIDHSVIDGVDESNIHSQEFEPMLPDRAASTYATYLLDSPTLHSCCELSRSRLPGFIYLGSCCTLDSRL